MLFDVDIFRSPELLNSPEKTGVMNSLRTMQVLQSLGTFILPYAVYALLVSGSIFAYAGLHKTPGVFLILMSAAGMICLVPFVNFVATCNEQLPFPKWVIDSEKQAAALTKAFLQMPDIGSLFLSFLIVAVLPAIGEECIFRGALQPLFIRLFRNHHAGIWLTAIVFSAVHMQFMGFFPICQAFMVLVSRVRLRVIHRQRRRELQLLHREAGADISQLGAARQALVDRVVGGDVGHHHAQQVVDVAAHPVELHHLRDGLGGGAKTLEPFRRVPVGLDSDEDRHADVHLARVHQRHLPGDDAGLAQALDAAPARRGGGADREGQVGHLDLGIALQLFEDAAVCGVNFHI